MINPSFKVVFVQNGKELDHLQQKSLFPVIVLESNHWMQLIFFLNRRMHNFHALLSLAGMHCYIAFVHVNVEYVGGPHVLH
jgi:hypothetical protein